MAGVMDKRQANDPYYVFKQYVAGRLRIPRNDGVALTYPHSHTI